MSVAPLMDGVHVYGNENVETSGRWSLTPPWYAGPRKVRYGFFVRLSSSSSRRKGKASTLDLMCVMLVVRVSMWSMHDHFP